MKLRYWIAILAAAALGSSSLAGVSRIITADGAGSGRISKPSSVLASHDESEHGPAFCSATSKLMLKACKAEVKDDYHTAQANCIQVLDAEDRAECVDEAVDERNEGHELCGEQYEARRDLCDEIGEARYDPDFDPEFYVDDFSDPENSNPYYPLVIGYQWMFETEDESNVVEVLPKTKLIEGVTCVVVNDVVTKDEGGGEDTDDWYAQRMDDTVSYCGESAKDFETFAGDAPQEPELIEIEGSFKHGRDGDLAGTLMPGSPEVGQAYRQEMSLGNAEDAAIVVSTTYGYGDDPEIDEFAPQELVDLLCSHDCVVTGEFTAIEPDVFEYKVYAYGIGLFLEVNPESGDINQLVDCNFDPRCDSLPRP